MNFWNRVTGSDMTKEFKDFENRAKKLPADYQKLWVEIKSNIWQHSNFTGRNLISIFDSALNILEEVNYSGQNSREILESNIKDFCLDLVGEEGANTFRDKWRKQINNNIEKKLGK